MQMSSHPLGCVAFHRGMNIPFVSAEDGTEGKRGSHMERTAVRSGPEVEAGGVSKCGVFFLALAESPLTDEHGCQGHKGEENILEFSI